MTGAPSTRLWPKRSGTGEFDVVAVGQNSLDRICVVDDVPALGEKAAALDYRELPGGQVATAALGCARLGLRTAYVGAVGDDAGAEHALAPLRQAGIDLAGVKRVAGARTQLAVILVERGSGERTVFWQRDPRLALAPEDLDFRRIRSARALLLDAGDPAAAAAAAGVARAAGAAAVLDADTLVPGVAELLDDVDFPIVSRSFAEAFSGGRTLRHGLDAIAARGARLAVVTLGAAGAVARAGELVIESPAFRVEVTDTTGAGDAFHAAFAWALLAGGSAEAVLRTANAAAALNCQSLGAQAGLPTSDQLERFLEAAA